LDYFKQVGVRNAVLKNAEKLDYILQALDLLRFAMDEKKMETITTMFVPLDFLNAIVYPSISKPIEKVWDGMVSDAVEEAKDNGLDGIYNLAQAKWFHKDNYGDYKFIKANQEILEELLKGKIKSLESLKKMYENEWIKNNYNEMIFPYTLFYYKIKKTGVDEYPLLARASRSCNIPCLILKKVYIFNPKKDLQFTYEKNINIIIQLFCELNSFPK